MRSPLLAVAVLTALALPVTAAQAQTVHDHLDEPTAVASPRAATVHLRPRAWEAKVIALTNARRTAHGVKPLRAARCPRRFAAPWARHMARIQLLVHHSSLGRLLHCGSSAHTAGENIAWNYDTPRSVVRGWMSDPPHRHNLLDPAFTRIGVAGARLGHGATYAIQDFVG